MRTEELSLIKNQLSDLFKAHRQISGIHKDSAIRVLSRVIENNKINFNEPVEVIFRGNIMLVTSVESKKDSLVKIKGSWNSCFSGSSCSASNKEIEVDLYLLSPDEVMEFAERIIKNIN